MSVVDARPNPTASDSAGPQLHIVADMTTARVVLAGELDLATVHLLRDAVAALPVATAQHVTIDLGRLQFVDAAGLGELVRIQADLTAAGRRLTLSRPSARIRRTATLAGLPDLLVPV